MSRHRVLISAPRVKDRQMLVALSIPDWSKDVCFYYDIENFDCQGLKCHVIFKFSSDQSYILTATAVLDIEKTDYNELNLRKWGFECNWTKEE